MKRIVDICRRLGGLVWALGIAGGANAQTTVPFAPGESGRATSETASVSTCTFVDRGLPAETVVIAAGGYGGRRLGFQIDQSGHEATQFDVAVHADKPVALLLGAYEPTIWNVGWSKGTRIVAVFATGYHRQAVAGLPKETPVIVSSYETKGPCEYNYIGGEGGLGWVNPRARSIFGFPATRVYTRAANGLLDIVESTQPKAPYETSPTTPPESFRDAKAPPAGDLGLKDAVAKGLLRAATADDVEAVRTHFASARKGSDVAADVPPVAGASPNAAPAVAMPAVSLRRGYVVLKPFAFPAGLYGGHSATFIVPKGVEAPTGNPGHSSVFDLNRTQSFCTAIRCP